MSYAKLQRQLIRKCKEDRSSIVTTMIDFYGLPGDFPKKDEIDRISDPFIKVVMAEKSMGENIDLTNFIPNIVLHEYETLLFSDISKFEMLFSKQEVNDLEKSIEGSIGPEYINDNPLSAPSKRIQRCFRGYNKPFHGSLLAMEIGLDTIRIKCPHFDRWLRTIEQLKEGT